MKKYLSIICALLTITSFASFGESNSSSEVPESSISETVTETTTEVTAETITKKQSYDLDADIDFNIASLSIPSFFNIDHNEENGDYAYLHTSWEDNNKHHELIFYFCRDPESYKKSGSFDKNNITDKFNINGNECMVDPDAYIPTTIFFTNEVASGRIHYDDEYEELVKQIIETIKFHIGKVETTTRKTTEKTNEPAELDNNYVAIGVGNHSTGISIDYNSEWETKEELNDTEMTITYTIKVSDKCKIVCRYILAPPSLLSAYAYAPNSEWIETNLEKHPNGSVKTNANGYDFLFYKDESDENIFQCSNGYTAFTMTVTKLCFSWEDIEDIQQAIFDSIDIIDSYELPEKEEITELPIIETTNSFEPFAISGTGSTVIQDVNIPAEFVVYSASHNGTSNFIAHFYDCNDKRESLVNEIGNYSCTQILNATYIDDSSSGMVEVNADGDWSITFSPVKAVVSNETSTSFSGYGANITGAFQSTGNMVCTVSHDGSSNFIVHAYELTKNGNKQPVANEIGEYNGQCVIRTKKDTLYFFCVDADGNWTINVE